MIFVVSVLQLLFFYNALKENDVEPASRAGAANRNAVARANWKSMLAVETVQVAIYHRLAVPATAKPGNEIARPVPHHFVYDAGYGDHFVEVKTVRESLIPFKGSRQQGGAGMHIGPGKRPAAALQLMQDTIKG